LHWIIEPEIFSIVIDIGTATLPRIKIYNLRANFFHVSLPILFFGQAERDEEVSKRFFDHHLSLLGADLVAFGLHFMVVIFTQDPMIKIPAIAM